MELRSGVAYDAELVTDVGRRLRPEICRLELVLQDDADAASARSGVGVGPGGPGGRPARAGCRRAVAAA
jgi:hypothetical protein